MRVGIRGRSADCRISHTTLSVKQVDNSHSENRRYDFLMTSGPHREHSEGDVALWIGILQTRRRCD